MKIRVPLCTILLAMVASATTVIDTHSISSGATADWGGKTSTGSYLESYGQTITAPFSDSSLSSFTFYVYLISTDQPVPLVRGYVTTWDGTGSAGTQLYESVDTALSPALGATQSVTFDPGSLALTPGQEYLLYFSVAPDAETTLGGVRSGYPNQDLYPGGEFVLRGEYVGSAPFPWTGTGFHTDLGFTAVFVPEPGPGLLCISGAAVLAAIRFRRRRSTPDQL